METDVGLYWLFSGIVAHPRNRGDVVIPLNTRHVGKQGCANTNKPECFVSMLTLCARSSTRKGFLSEAIPSLSIRGMGAMDSSKSSPSMGLSVYWFTVRATM